MRVLLLTVFKDTLGEAEAQEGSMTVLIYVDTSKEVGDPDHLKVFANADAAAPLSTRGIVASGARELSRP